MTEPFREPIILSFTDDTGKIPAFEEMTIDDEDSIGESSEMFPDAEQTKIKQRSYEAVVLSEEELDEVKISGPIPYQINNIFYQGDELERKKQSGTGLGCVNTCFGPFRVAFQEKHKLQNIQSIHQQNSLNIAPLRPSFNNLNPLQQVQPKSVNQQVNETSQMPTNELPSIRDNPFIKNITKTKTQQQNKLPSPLDQFRQPIDINNTQSYSQVLSRDHPVSYNSSMVHSDEEDPTKQGFHLDYLEKVHLSDDISIPEKEVNHSYSRKTNKNPKRIKLMKGIEEENSVLLKDKSRNGKKISRKKEIDIEVVSGKLHMNKDLVICSSILGAIMNNQESEPFKTEVDPIALNILDYYKIVKHPMDLETVSIKLSKGLYKTKEDFKKDMKLIFENAKIYNSSENSIHQSAINLMKKFDKMFNSAFLENNPPKLILPEQVSVTPTFLPVAVRPIYEHSNFYYCDEAEIEEMKEKMAKIRGTKYQRKQMTIKEKEVLTNQISKMSSERINLLFNVLGIFKEPGRVVEINLNDYDEEELINIKKIVNGTFSIPHDFLELLQVNKN
ncbi:bromodomain containing protein [Entamoeba histolytica HM-1:IMSS-B]|uniref:Bromodomain protein, putative n=6 Tax=Entamoeba histolytica TaxID=5759 RepID=C4M7M6_ENTH1|nr:bromodomain protein, putative [Entamoeba histolytica HM-1:IMSS]EMD46207.1 bromo domain containing protein [Entamoeba histolytica KU27]EMH75091.1 bromodomain containing protein [Entamoeba histolytica HM-1:IMSS-B]EMS11863.1 bromodomain containing protein [Entamoeba histolytica HM-3:IMSS]ENY60636.1 bromodomain containing protein [Entamoeba histolytica HM-1:IMSS-A]GAT97542.1 bromodomain-containing protein [Entamoeba histolytica]|eukprot:XP_655396.1 bromodomain protein, putative [Entamoeba histolytica HM-1:IMSS]